MAQQLNRSWMGAIATTILFGVTSIIFPGLAQPPVDLPRQQEQPRSGSVPPPVKIHPFNVEKNERFKASRMPSPKELVDEVWQRVERSYVDSTFNKKDWKAIRTRYVDRSYNSLEEAYLAINEMLKLLGDPLTRFLNPSVFKAMQIDSSSNVVGVGLQLAKDEKIQKITIIAPIEDGPAWKAGVLAGDILTQIDGQNTERMDVNTAVMLLQGKPATFVTLALLRDGKPLELRIQRAKVEIRPVRYNAQETTIGKVGYIRFTQFSANATNEMKTAIAMLEAQKVKGYILDLRSNPGGLLYAAIEITRLWLPKGVIVSTVDRNGVRDQEQANNRALTDKPLVVLIDGGSASASEIMAAALQANQRALLVGTRTGGNNSIQSVRSLKGGSGLAVTIARWLTPNGHDINKVGIEPDVTVKLTEVQKRQLAANRNQIGTVADSQYAIALKTLSDRLDIAK